MKATKIFMMAALALTFAACSNEDNDLAQQPANGEITITATLTTDDGASTRALSIDGPNIASTWETTDEFAILYNNGTEDTKSIATVDKIDGTTVTITFTIPASLADNTDCTIVYPASAAKADNTGADVATALAAQDGTIGNCPEVRVGTATIDKDNHNLSSVTKLAAQNAIFKFTTKNSDGSANIDVMSLTVTIGTQNYDITLASATSELYAALPAVSGQDVTFTATGSDSKKYTVSKDNVTFSAGNYYQSPLKMAVPTYLAWDGTQKELVATEIPTDATAVSNASGNVNWAAGTYVVVGNVTISGAVSLQGAVNLIIKDGAKLTVGRIDGANYDLSIFGQSNMTGELVVKNNNRHAIHSLSTLEIHSCKVTALGVLNGRWGLDDIGTINVYGGSVDSKASENGYGNGICLKNAGSMNIYGGLVKAEGKGSFNSNCYGVEGSATITVYGGKLWAGSPNKQAFGSNVTLTKGASFTGKIQTSNDNTTWTDWTTDGTPTTKYVKVE